MITFSCECGKRHQVKDELAGKRGKCSCGKTLVIPQSVEASSASTIPNAVAVAQPSNQPTPILGIAEAYAAMLANASQADEQPTAATTQSMATSALSNPDFRVEGL
ncbi:MAG: hypothetical protein WD971_07625 [Pirellulales bacterium]